MNSIFSNYETNKLIISNPESVNLLIVAILFLLTIFTAKRREQHSFLDFKTTDQARGLAILMVVLGHVWVHVTNVKPNLVMSGYGVAVFLFLSGYGISLSLARNRDKLGAFFIKRINKVFKPYWIATFCILLLDYLLLKKSYPVKDIFFTMIGINVYGIMHHFDYVRWYITFLLFWYIIVIFSFHMKKMSCFLPLILGLLSFVFDYYFLKFGWYQYYAFPLGCLLARYRLSIKAFVERMSKWQNYTIIIAFFLSLLFRIYILDILQGDIPTIGISFMKDLVGVIISISIIFYLNSIKNYYSQFLILFGKYSYEIFLFHGVFMVKYNPVFEFGGLIWTFFIYLLIISLLALLFKEIVRLINIKNIIHLTNIRMLYV